MTVELTKQEVQMILQMINATPVKGADAMTVMLSLHHKLSDAQRETPPLAAVPAEAFD